MKMIAFNGSPRKDGNTASLLKKALEGASSKGAETEFVNLYDLNFKGCVSCFACKLKGGKSYGKCARKDDLEPLLNKVEEADAIILGSPIYFGNVSGEMRSLMERLLFQYLVYSNTDSRTLFPRSTMVGFIYTMNVSEEILIAVKYDELFMNYERTFKRIFRGEVETLCSTDTYQFKDYSKYVADMFDAEAKLKRHYEVFPVDLEKAFEMGARFAETK
jgi:multimeric flavodoxin WrbA